MVADAVEAIGGKLYMLGGGWDMIWVGSFDQPVPFGLACTVLVPWNETDDDHVFSVSIENEDGGEVAPRLDVPFKTGRSPTTPKGAPTRVAVGIKAAILLPGPGGYAFVGRVDGRDDSERRTIVHARGVGA
jgi:hypothetical protein